MGRRSEFTPARKRDAISLLRNGMLLPQHPMIRASAARRGRAILDKATGHRLAC